MAYICLKTEAFRSDNNARQVHFTYIFGYQFRTAIGKYNLDNTSVMLTMRGRVYTRLYVVYIRLVSQSVCVAVCMRALVRECMRVCVWVCVCKHSCYGTYICYCLVSVRWLHSVSHIRKLFTCLNLMMEQQREVIQKVLHNSLQDDGIEPKASGALAWPVWYEFFGNRCTPGSSMTWYILPFSEMKDRKFAKQIDLVKTDVLCKVLSCLYHCQYVW